MPIKLARDFPLIDELYFSSRVSFPKLELSTYYWKSINHHNSGSLIILLRLDQSSRCIVLIQTSICAALYCNNRVGDIASSNRLYMGFNFVFGASATCLGKRSSVVGPSNSPWCHRGPQPTSPKSCLSESAEAVRYASPV